MIIGLTGTYCAGKNYIASILESKGLPVLDVDKMGHQVLESEKKEIFTKFGFDLQKADGSLDRQLLGQRVFGKPEKLSALEAIIHPAVNQLTEEWIISQNGNCVINAALLHRSSVFEKLECIILVTAPVITRLIRAKRRDRLSWITLLKRFNSQKGFNTQYLSKKAEIYRVGNFGLPCNSGCTGKPGKSSSSKLENRIEKILEGIYKTWKKK